MNVVGGIAGDPALGADQAYQVVGDAELEGLREFVREVIRRCRKGDAQDGKSVCLYTHDGKRLLGRHRSRASAERQERAVKAHGG